jgi:hypothetical protein
MNMNKWFLECRLSVCMYSCLAVSELLGGFRSYSGFPECLFIIGLRPVDMAIIYPKNKDPSDEPTKSKWRVSRKRFMVKFR